MNILQIQNCGFQFYSLNKINIHLNTKTLILVFFSLLSINTYIHAQNKIEPINSGIGDTVNVYLENGSIIQGIFLSKTPDSLKIKTEYFGELSISFVQIKKIEGKTELVHNLRYETFKDPNQTRAFLMPTSINLPAGKGYVGDYELLFFTAAVGVTDWLMINGGFLLLPIPIEDQVLNFGLKAQILPFTKGFGFSVGAQFLTIPNEEYKPGICYGVFSYGNENAKFNIGMGIGFNINSNNESAFLLALSADARVSTHIKLLGETWISRKGDFVPIILGVRFFGDKLSGDLGLLYPLGESWPSPIGIPVGNLIYNF